MNGIQRERAKSRVTALRWRWRTKPVSEMIQASLRNGPRNAENKGRVCWARTRRKCKGEGGGDRVSKKGKCRKKAGGTKRVIRALFSGLFGSFGHAPSLAPCSSHVGISQLTNVVHGGCRTRPHRLRGDCQLWTTPFWKRSGEDE